MAAMNGLLTKMPVRPAANFAYRYPSQAPGGSGTVCCDPHIGTDPGHVSFFPPDFFAILAKLLAIIPGQVIPATCILMPVSKLIEEWVYRLM